MAQLTLREEMDKYRNMLTESVVSEKWNTDYETPKSKRGMFKGRSKESLEKELNRLKAKKTKTEADKTKEHQLVFALRSKGGWKKGEGAMKESIIREGMRLSFEKLLKDYHVEVDSFIEGGDLAENLYNALYEYYFDDMPYGIAKARSGDPYEWVQDRFQRDLESEGLLGAERSADSIDVIPEAEPNVLEFKLNTTPGPFSKKAFENWVNSKKSS